MYSNKFRFGPHAMPDMGTSPHVCDVAPKPSDTFSATKAVFTSRITDLTITVATKTEADGSSRLTYGELNKPEP